MSTDISSSSLYSLRSPDFLVRKFRDSPNPLLSALEEYKNVIISHICLLSLEDVNFCEMEIEMDKSKLFPSFAEYFVDSNYTGDFSTPLERIETINAFHKENISYYFNTFSEKITRINEQVSFIRKTVHYMAIRGELTQERKEALLRDIQKDFEKIESIIRELEKLTSSLSIPSERYQKIISETPPQK